MKKLTRKLESQAGESITETLVALLIAAFALIMLAGAMTASSRVVTKSREKMNEYYSANEEDNGVMIREEAGEPVTGGITITDEVGTSDIIAFQPFDIEYFKNNKIGNTPVVAYNYNSNSGT